MKKCTLSRFRRYGPTQKAVLVLSLTGAAVIVSLPVSWAFKKVNLGVSMEAAEVTLAFQVFVALVLTAIGIGLGYLMDWTIRRRRFVFHTPKEGSCAEALVRLWGYELVCQEEAEHKIAPEINLFPNFEETRNIANRPKRRGRKPTVPLEAWLPIAAKWENRDPIRDAFTLEDLIREHLGENLDGSPMVSAQSYYNTWRERALEELHRRAEARQLASQTDPDRPPE